MLLKKKNCHTSAWILSYFSLNSVILQPIFSFTGRYGKFFTRLQRVLFGCLYFKNAIIIQNFFRISYLMTYFSQNTINLVYLDVSINEIIQTTHCCNKDEEKEGSQHTTLGYPIDYQLVLCTHHLLSTHYLRCLHARSLHDVWQMHIFVYPTKFPLYNLIADRPKWFAIISGINILVTIDYGCTDNHLMIGLLVEVYSWFYWFIVLYVTCAFYKRNTYLVNVALGYIVPLQLLNNFWWLDNCTTVCNRNAATTRWI